MYKSKERNQKRKADSIGYINLWDICVLKGKPKTSKETTDTTGLYTEYILRVTVNQD